jgi:hypothetical protein
LEFILGLKHTELLQFFVIIGKEGLGLSAAATHLFLGVKSPNSKDKSGTGAVNAFKIYYT